MKRIAIVPIVFTGAVFAQTTKPAISCGDLRSLTHSEVSISYAVNMAASTTVPEHCRVRGQVLPQVGFEMNLPSEWNGRLHMSGNGGYAGDALDDAVRHIPAREGLLRAGFATVVTDTGHSSATEPLGSFAADWQKLLDYAFRSLHVSALAAKALVNAYYGSPAAHSYFQGCSTGGRQALILAQRFPDDFDGIIAGAPVLSFSGTMASYARVVQALKAAPVPSSKLPLLAERIYSQCDAKDGLKDGVIDDPRSCNFKPATDLPRCDAAADGADCFTAAQIRSLQTIYSDMTVDGKRIFPGWPVGAENGWNNWFVRADGAPTTQESFSESFFRYLVPSHPDPQFNLSQFTAERDVPRLENIHRILDATDTDLSRFRQRGGKLLMYFGWADPALNPMMGVEYYQQTSERMGTSTPEFFRLFMVPGMFHCSGGPGADSFDTLQPIVDWVEKGTAPDSMVASKVAQGKTVRSRPLCPYPAVAKYKGSGSSDEAGNFTCVKP